MDETRFGKRDKRGHWTPNAPLHPAPLLDFPLRIAAIIKWLPHYFLPWNVLFAASAVAYFYAFVPAQDELQHWHWGWVLKLLITNSILVALFYGIFELRLYVQRRQGTRFKYNAKFPAEHKSTAFLFQSQMIDSLIRGFGTGVPIWTGFEALVLHLQATGWAPSVSFAEHPLYLLGLYLVLPLFHEVHFFAIHRLIHTPFLYKWVHSVHHNSVNPSPWSSLSMHPVEHLLYFSTALLHCLVPSNPILLIYQLHMSGFGAIVGHIGFDRLELTDETAIESHAFAHYLHHKYFEVNYADGLIPFDKWFGTWHDGTAEGDRLMAARYASRKAKVNG